MIPLIKLTDRQFNYLLIHTKFDRFSFFCLVSLSFTHYFILFAHLLILNYLDHLSL